MCLLYTEKQVFQRNKPFNQTPWLRSATLTTLKTGPGERNHACKQVLKERKKMKDLDIRRNKEK